MSCFALNPLVPDPFLGHGRLPRWGWPSSRSTPVCLATAVRAFPEPGKGQLRGRG
jgi:hypothetical protein